MKSATYIIEITNQKNEKYLSEGRNPLACLPACLLTLCQLRNFAVFDQSSCTIYLTCYRLVLFFSYYFIFPFSPIFPIFPIARSYFSYVFIFMV